MYVAEVEIYADDSNQAVIRHPSRNFPGSLIQGDTLNALVSDLAEAISDLESGNAEDCRDTLQVLHEKLSDRLQHYGSVLTAHSIDLPYKTA